MYTGLTDIDQQGNIVPGIAESWEPNKELTSWVFRLRKGVLFHNGREVDAEAVKLNILRIKDPAIGSDWHRGAVENIESVDVLDKYTVRFNANMPDVTVPSSVMHYPTNLQAPDNFDKAADHPIGTGPFKFVSWTRLNETRLVRFENYWETDAEGNNLPYLDEIVGKPKKEDSVRLTALRTGQVISLMPWPTPTSSASRRATATNTTSGRGIPAASLWSSTSASGPFQDKRLRTAAAHAIDRQAIHNSVFYGQGDMLDQPYPRGNPWHLESRSLRVRSRQGENLAQAGPRRGHRPQDRLSSLTRLQLASVARSSRSSGTASASRWTWSPSIPCPSSQARKQGDFDGLIQGNTFRFDPDDFFGRNLHSKSEYAQVLSGWQNERYDQLVEEAKRHWTQPSARNCTPRPGTS